MKKAAGEAAIQKFGDKLKDADFMEKYRSKLSPFRKVTGNPEWFSSFDPKSIYINCSTEYKPQVFGVDPTTGKACDIAGEDVVYSGCFGRAKLTVYAYDKPGNKGVRFGLGGFQKTWDGEHLGGVGARVEDFEPLPVDEKAATTSSKSSAGTTAPAAAPKDTIDELFQ